jgi:hypothetical protein
LLLFPLCLPFQCLLSLALIPPHLLPLLCLLSCVAAGKPRRLSLKFLKEERVRLERWREGCRQQYVTGAAAVSDPKVADHLPLPLGVGQRVAARHPATRQLHDGSVLTVANSYYR